MPDAQRFGLPHGHIGRRELAFAQVDFGELREGLGGQRERTGVAGDVELPLDERAKPQSPEPRPMLSRVAPSEPKRCESRRARGRGELLARQRLAVARRARRDVRDAAATPATTTASWRAPRIRRRAGARCRSGSSVIVKDASVLSAGSGGRAGDTRRVRHCAAVWRNAVVAPPGCASSVVRMSSSSSQAWETAENSVLQGRGVIVESEVPT